MISAYGKPQTTIISIAGLLLLVLGGVLGFTTALGNAAWIGGIVVGVLTLLLLAFFRDPERDIPTMRHQVVAPADGRVRSVHHLEHFEPFDGPAVCIRIFLSVFNVHINRIPIHGRVIRIDRKDGGFRNAMREDAAEHNQSTTILLHHPTHDLPVAAVRQITGAIARRIVTGVEEGEIVQRGQRYGMIKLGSTTELYLPRPDSVQVHARVGQKVRAGESILAVTAPIMKKGEADIPAQPGAASTTSNASAESAPSPRSAEPASSANPGDDTG